MNEESILQERKDKILSKIISGSNWVYYLILAAIVLFAVKIRTLNLPGLRDSTTGAWALGPDLDPWLFTRYAEYIVEHGKLYALDTMRYFPIGYETNRELLLHPYMMAFFHKIAVIFGSESVVQSAAIYPVFMFALTVIAFFFFVRKIFSDSLGNKNSSIIALISSVFLSIIPALLPRTIAGIPEKESAAFFFLFLTFYLFLSAWKSEKTKTQILSAILAGLSTAAMALIWGGVGFLFFTIGPFILVSYLLGQLSKRRSYVSLIWILVSLGVMSPFAARYSFIGLLTSTSIALPVSALISSLIEHKILRNFLKSKIDNSFLRNIPDRAIAFFLTMIIGAIFLMVFVSPFYFITEAKNIIQTLVTPITDRLGVTVAENRQPFFQEWSSNFGPTVNGFPVFFILFLAGSVYLFYSMLKVLSNRQRLFGTFGYITFLFALIFSRYNPSFISSLDKQGLFVRNIYFLSGFIFILAFLFYQLYLIFKSERENKFYDYFAGIPLLCLSIILFFVLTTGNENGKYLLNGTNLTSLFVYFLGPLILFFFLARAGLADSVKKSDTYSALFGLIALLLFTNSILFSSSILVYIAAILAIPFLVLTIIGLIKQSEFQDIDLGIIMLFIFFFLSLVSARGAVRVTMVLVPSASIIASYFIVSTFNKAKKVKSQNKKIIVWTLAVLIIFSALYSAFLSSESFYKSTSIQAVSFVPTAYNVQWQRAMSFVRENTQEDAVFGHWWDYGYWLQSIGKRATVLDGGNAVGYWNHLMGRYALTGSDNKEALDFLYAHGTTHFLIDSTDIGKYGAFSSIGSDANFDRSSQLAVFQRDSSQSIESNNSLISIYSGGVPTESDIIYDLNGKRIFLPAGGTTVAGIIVRTTSDNLKILDQPQAIFVYQGQQYALPMRYAFELSSNELRDFGSGLEYGYFPFPRIINTQEGSQFESSGTIIFLSERTVKSQLARLYFYKENNPNFKLIHSEQDLLIEQIKSQDIGFSSDFVYFQGQLRGPIRIWEINYPSNMQLNESYLEKTFPDETLTATM